MTVSWVAESIIRRSIGKTHTVHKRIYTYSDHNRRNFTTHRPSTISYIYISQDVSKLHPSLVQPIAVLSRRHIACGWSSRGLVSSPAKFCTALRPSLHRAPNWIPVWLPNGSRSLSIGEGAAAKSETKPWKFPAFWQNDFTLPCPLSHSNAAESNWPNWSDLTEGQSERCLDCKLRTSQTGNERVQLVEVTQAVVPGALGLYV